MSILQLKNITKRYDDKLVVDNVNFSIEKGDTFGLLGPNGAGKSTIISTICGLVKPDQGDILIDGISLTKDPQAAKKNIGFVPQDIALYENLNAIDNLKFWGTLYGLSGSLLKSRIDEALEVTELKARAKEKLKTYSGGMKRRINIAAAFMHHPKLLIMDEPTVGIDPQSRNHILEFTKNLNKEYGTSVIYTSHYMEEVEVLCNRLIILDEGKVIASGSKEEITRMISSSETIEITLSNYSREIGFKIENLSAVQGTSFKDNLLTIITNNNNKNGIQDIMDIIFQGNGKIQNLNVKVPNLEAVFLNLTGKNLRD